jgi:hypothetical protein
MVLQLPPELKHDDRLTRQDLPAVDQFDPNDDGLVEEKPLVERGTLMPLNPKQLPQTIVNGLSNFLAPEHLRGPLALIYRPIFIAAIGLHALLLFSGGGKHEEKKEVKDKEKPATITQIATGKAAPKKLNKLPTTKLKPALPKLSTPNPQAPSIKSASKPEDINQPEDSKKPEETPDRKSAELAGKPLPDVSPMPPGDSIDPNNPFADFPHMGTKNAQDEYVVSGNQVAAVLANFSKALLDKKYTIESAVQASGRATLPFSKGGKQAFLNIFQEGSNVVYILTSSEVKSLDEWRGILKVPDDFVSLIGSLPEPQGATDGSGSESSTPDETNFAEPSAFFQADNSFKAEIGGISPKRVTGYDPQTLYSELVSDLKQVFDEVSPAGTHGGGQLYQMKKGKTVLFLNLVGDPKGNSTNIVVWTKQPS